MQSQIREWGKSNLIFVNLRTTLIAFTATVEGVHHMAELDEGLKKLLETNFGLVPKSAPAKAETKTALAPAAKPEAPETVDSKRETFKRLGVSRMHRALTAIRLLGNLASPHYHYTEHDIEMMRLALSDAIGVALDKFRKRAQARSDHFEFSDGDTGGLDDML
jgi:hypothetical protein